MILASALLLACAPEPPPPVGRTAVVLIVSDPTPVPATCVGQTARLVLGEPLTDACDLRDGTIRGDVVAGMLLADGTWDERIIPAEVAP